MARNVNVTLERKRLQEETIVYLYAPKEEALVPIENIRATRKNARNLTNIDIANWILEQRRPRKKTLQRKSTTIIMHTKKEAELQLLDNQFSRRIIPMQRRILQQCSKMKRMQ